MTYREPAQAGFCGSGSAEAGRKLEAAGRPSRSLLFALLPAPLNEESRRGALALWDAVLGIGTGLSLVAFIAAIALFAYRARLRHRDQIIASAPAEDKIAAIEAVAEYLRIDVSGLNNREKHDIVIRQLKIKEQREALLGRLAIIVAVLFALVAVIAMLADTGVAIFSDRLRSPTNNNPPPSPSTSQPSKPSTASIEYKVCRGSRQSPSYCPAGAVYLTCGDDVQAWAKSKCAEFTAKQTYVTSGGMCGFEAVTVTCTAPL